MTRLEITTKIPEVQGILFPGCGVKFTGYENVFLQKFDYDARALFKRATECSSFIHTDLSSVTEEVSDELQNQLLTYVYSCAFSDIIRRLYSNVDWCTFYSMGIYAALYHAGVYRFEAGLKLVETAYKTIMAAKGDTSYAITTIIGLEYAVIENHIKSIGGLLDIINENNSLSFVVCGESVKIKILVDAVIDDGAMKTVMLPLSAPYHAVKDYSKLESLRVCCDDIVTGVPDIKIISCVNQTVLDTTEKVKQAVLENVAFPINWRKTFELLLASGNSMFFESGPGESLYKAGKFIDGEFTIAGCKKYCAQ